MRRQTGYLFVISHMRSYSTLLTHILGSHPEIDGYAEQLRAYESRYDLSAMGPRIEQNTGERRKGRWLLDKILHNEGTMSDDVIRTPELRLLLLVRDPVTTILFLNRHSLHTASSLKLSHWYCIFFNFHQKH